MLQFPAKTSVSQQIKMAEGGSGNMRPGHSRSKRKGRSRRGKKHRKQAKLDQEDVDFLKENTKFDEAEIREWYKGFSVKLIFPNSLKKNSIFFLFSGRLPRWEFGQRQDFGYVFNDSSSEKCHRFC